MTKFNKILLFILAFIIILCFVYYIQKNRRELFENETSNKYQNKDIEIVVSRFNEDLEWLKDEPFNKYPIVCYNKGLNDDFYKPDNMRIVKLENLGREYHTYLYHIINNYDNIKTFTMFLPGSTQQQHKMIRAKKWLEEIENNIENINNYCHFIENGVLEDTKDFKLDAYSASDPKNLSINNSNFLLPSEKRPFGEWYSHHFKKKKIQNICWNGIFGIHKDYVIQHPKSYYDVFFKELNTHSNPEVGHYYERGFVALFYPLNDKK